MAITPNGPGAGLEPTSASEPRSGSLADVLDVILDKGIVIDAFVRVSLVGIEILTLDARIVVASVDTYMHFAREAHRLEMGGGQGSAKQGLAGMMGKLAEGGAHNIARGALQGAGEGLREGLVPHRTQPQDRRGIVQRAVGAVKDKAGEAIQNTLSPGDGEEEGNGQASEGERSTPEESRTSASASAGQEPAAPRRRGARPGGSTAQGGTRRRAAPSSRRAPPRDPGD